MRMLEHVTAFSIRLFGLGGGLEKFCGPSAHKFFLAFFFSGSAIPGSVNPAGSTLVRPTLDCRNLAETSPKPHQVCAETSPKKLSWVSSLINPFEGYKIETAI